MNKLSKLSLAILTLLGPASISYTQQPQPTMTSAQPQKAVGAFEPKTAPLNAEGATIGRFSLDKKYGGGLEATASGEMMGVRTPVKGSAGYVAVEKVTGKLAGRTGSFYLMHYGIMNRGEFRLTITVVPDSGTDELAGLTDWPS